MKNNILYLSILVFSISLCVSCKEGVAKQENTIEMVTSQEMEDLSKMEEVKVIDVRSEEEFNAEHIKDAQNIVYDKNFSDKIADLDKSKPVIVYCKSGKRSEKSAQILKDSGFVKVYDLKGGITQWKYDKKETEK